MKILTRRFVRLSGVAAALMATQVGAAGYTIDFSNSRGTGTSTDDVLVENIRVLIPIPNPFDPSSSTTSTATYNVNFRFDPATLHLVPYSIRAGGSGGCAGANIQVYNALLGVSGPIAGASVTIGTQTVATNSAGVASFTNLPEGNVSVSVSAPNYTAATQTASLVCGTTTGVNRTTLALSPSTGTGALTANQFRVILTWGENPSDLDSHLTGPTQNSADRWHVAYFDQAAGGLCGLDVDDVTSYGPETVTCPATGAGTTPLIPGIYRYSIHHYSGSLSIKESAAQVRLELNGNVYNYAPPAAGSYSGWDDVWTVFELTVNANGTISVAPVNTVTNNVSEYDIRSARGGSAETTYGRAEDRSLFLNLSK